jgi:8-oxo-dGTP diphosphatase
MSVWVVRHADAKSRGAWPKADELRPLTHKGEEQAAGLPALFGHAPVRRLLSSPAVRCVSTLAPLAHRLGLSVRVDRTLAEGGDPTKAYELLCGLLAKKGDTALCMHGDLIPEILRTAARDGVQFADEPRWPKGSTWVLEADGRRFTSARYLPPPEQ